MRLVCDNAIKLFPGTAPGSEGFTLEEEFKRKTERLSI